MGVRRPDKLLKVDVLQVGGAAVPATQASGAQQAGQAGAGVVLAFSEERDLGREGKGVAPSPTEDGPPGQEPLASPALANVSLPPPQHNKNSFTEEEAEAQSGQARAKITQPTCGGARI